MLLSHVYILQILFLHNVVYNVLSDNKNCCYKIVVTLLVISSSHASPVASLSSVGPVASSSSAILVSFPKVARKSSSCYKFLCASH